MATNKKSFVLYCDQKHIFNELSDREAGKLIKHIFSYVTDEDPKLIERILKISFEPIKQQLKRDLKNWEDERQNRSNAGKKGMESRWGKRKKITKDNKNNIVINPITGITDNVTVTVNDTVTVNERANTGSHDLKNSNLYRKPNIPTKHQVFETFINSGGNREMAKSFWEKHDATGWFINGSPIQNYVSLATKFITNWNKNEKTHDAPAAPKLKNINQLLNGKP